MKSSGASQMVLSKMLKDQQDKYNKSHRGKDYLSNERLFSYAAVYYKQYSPISCLIMGEYFDDEVDQALIQRMMGEAKKRKVGAKDTPLEMDDEDWRPYLKGEYRITSNKQMDDYMEGNYVRVDKPNELYYALARAARLPEHDINIAFSEGQWLDKKFYCRQYVKDVCRYYLQKRELSPPKLAEAIKLVGTKNLGTTTIRELIWNEKPINYEQFNIFAELLSIPKKYTNRCRCMIAEAENPFAFEYGYWCAVDEAKEEPEIFAEGILAPIINEGVSGLEYKHLQEEVAELRIALEAYNKIFRGPFMARTLFHEYYQSRGFSFEPYSGYEHIPEEYHASVLWNMAKMWVTLPNGEKYIIQTEEYEHIMEKIEDYAEYLLWKAATHPEKPKDDDIDS